MKAKKRATVMAKTRDYLKAYSMVELWEGQKDNMKELTRVTN